MSYASYVSRVLGEIPGIGKMLSDKVIEVREDTPESAWVISDGKYGETSATSLAASKDVLENMGFQASQMSLGIQGVPASGKVLIRGKKKNPPTKPVASFWYACQRQAKERLAKGGATAIQSEEYGNTMMSFIQDPIIVGMAEALSHQTPPVLRRDIAHDNGTPKHHFMMSANETYARLCRENGRTPLGGHLGAAATAILAHYSDAQEVSISKELVGDFERRFRAKENVGS